MTAPPKPGRPASPWDDPRLIFPDEPTWRGLTPAQQEDVIDRIVAALDEYQGLLSAAVAAMALGVIALCDARGLALTPEQHARVVSDSDVTALTRWLTLAATARDASELFREG